MRIILLSLMFISIVGLFIEMWIVFNKSKTMLHNNLLLSCLAIIINDVGYLLELLSTTKEQCITAVQFSYFGRVWISFLFFKFTAELCNIKIPNILRKILPVIHMAIYGTILTMNYNDLYYTDIEYVTDGLFSRIKHGDGVAHHFLMQLNIIYIICIFTWLFMSYAKKKSPIAKKRIGYVIIGFLAEASLFIIQISRVFSFTEEFDVSILGYIILTFFMYMSILKCNLLGVIDLDRENMIDQVGEAVIALDSDNRIQYYNEPMVKLYPKIISEPEEVLQEIEEAIENHDDITIKNKIYTPNENPIYTDGECLGKMYSMVDATELKQNEYKLKADAEILEMAAKSMKERLFSAEEMVQQDRAMRHDRRHFEALLMTLLEDGKVDEAKKCLEERLAQEPRSCRHYCENTTVNAAITHYAALAERNNIQMDVSTNIPFNPGVDEMQLAITISNLLENAIHACEKLPENERRIELKAKFKEQLLLEIVNTCEKKVPLDKMGHPFAEEDGHGVGTRSVLAFVDQTNSEIKYIAEDNRFKVRMIIG